MDCYVLSDLEKVTIENCLRSKSYSSHQFHPECSSMDLVCSVIDDVVFGKIPFEVCDRRTSKPLSLPEGPCTMSWASIQTTPDNRNSCCTRSEFEAPTCLNCHKTFMNQATLSRHMRRTCNSFSGREIPTSDDVLLASTLNDTNLSDLLSRPYLSCGAVFTDQKSASSHFSRSLSKQRYAVFNQWFRQKTRKERNLERTKTQSSMNSVKCTNAKRYQKLKLSRKLLYQRVLASKLKKKYTTELAKAKLWSLFCYSK